MGECFNALNRWFLFAVKKTLVRVRSHVLMMRVYSLCHGFSAPLCVRRIQG